MATMMRLFGVRLSKFVVHAARLKPIIAPTTSSARRSGGRLRYLVLLGVPISFTVAWAEPNLTLDWLPLLESIRNDRDLFDRFATATDSDGSPYMMPEDVLRSLALNLGPGSSVQQHLVERTQAIFELADSNHDGRISWEEYSFFIKLLATGPNQLLVAFRMFDFDNDGTISRSEFQRVLLAHTGTRLAPPSSIPAATKSMEGSLVGKFFGQNSDNSISFHQFVEFLVQLQKEILDIQYDSSQSGFIEFSKYSLLFLSHSNLVKSTIKRVNKLPAHLAALKVSLAEYHLIERILSDLNNVVIGLRFIGHDKVTPESFQIVVKRLFKADLPLDHIRAILFLLDSDDDGIVTRHDIVRWESQRSRLGEIHNVDHSWRSKWTSFWHCVSQ